MIAPFQERPKACRMILSAALAMLLSAPGSGVAKARIIWLDTQVTSYPAKAFREAHPNCYPGDMVHFGHTLSSDDLIVVGRIRSTVPKYYSTWYGQGTVEVLEVLHGICEADSVQCLSTNTFIPMGKSGCSIARTIDGPGWIIPGDIVLLALRKEQANPSIMGMYFVGEVRYLQTVPASGDQVTYVQYDEPSFDWDVYEQDVARGEDADPYNYLTVRRAQSESFKDDVAALLGKEE